MPLHYTKNKQYVDREIKQSRNIFTITLATPAQTSVVMVIDAFVGFRGLLPMPF